MIGAGPAGSAAAGRSAQLGLKALLLEKERIPRDKLCGGGVTPKVLKLLDFDLPEEIIESAPTSARIHVGSKCFDFHASDPLVYMTSRAKFDTLLSKRAEEAGAQIKDGVLVQNILRHPACVEVQTLDESFEAMIVIGCDGTAGPTARACGLYARWNPNTVAYAIESEVPVGVDGVHRFVGAEPCFDVYFGVSPAGYGWVFPKDDHLTIGVGCRMSKLRDGPALFKSFLKCIPELAGHDVPSPKAHLIPLAGTGRVPMVADRVLLAGDSAGFAEALLGEGIYFAIKGGQIAAEITDEACKSGRFSECLAKYERRCDREFGADFAAAYKLARLSYLENYDMDRLAQFFFSDKRFHDCMVGLMNGSIRHRDVPTKLAWPYFKYKLARLGLPIQA
ncbi:MAG TPA: NAD(P)/FAD-dependent oxidoreductase [Candidatus Acidoferrales bacterium]|nr:NAD(P)/FAD-dependent oxidoreductase [Candidatus Acidoferrales bacterium]